MWRELSDLNSLFEVLILAVLIFALLTFLRGSRGEGMLKILGSVLAIAYIGLRALALAFPGGELKRLTLVLDAIFQASVIALVVIFQPELRRGLALKIPRFFAGTVPEHQIVEEVVLAASRCAKAKIGALIALERDSSLKEYVQSGTHIDAEVKADLLRTIFYVGTPLHDGAVIITGGRIAAAGCFLPLTDNPNVPKALGTRHRAGIGLSEVEDALVVIVSEETGQISLAEAGTLHRDLDRDTLQRLLDELYLARQEEKPPQQPPPGEGNLGEGEPLEADTTTRLKRPPGKPVTTTRTVRRTIP